METLNYEVLKKSGYNGYIKESAPEKVMQFGEGNFLRAFVDYFFDCANEKADWNGKVVLVQPIAQGLTKLINDQEGLYTLYLRGSEKGEKVDLKRVISSVSRCINPYDDFDAVLELAKSDDLEYIVSNTTEAGIVHESESKFDQCPPISFPAKLTRVLYERYKAGKDGVVVLSCELIDNNGKELQKCVNEYIDDWGLEEEFKTWINEKNTFCSTLVDRIVPGRVRDAEEVKKMEEANGYHDELIDVGEIFGVWIIEGPAGLEDKLPFKKAGLNVQVVEDVTPYKKRKVRILNGAHTGFVLGAYLSGQDIVRDCMHNETIKGFMNKMLYDEIIPTLPLDKQDLLDFATAVSDNEKGEIPTCLAMSLAAYIAFYSNDIQRREDAALVCKRPKGNEYKVQDDAWALDFYYAHKDDSAEELVKAVLSNKDMWDQDLTEIKGLEELIVADLKKIREEGAEAAYASCL